MDLRRRRPERPRGGESDPERGVGEVVMMRGRLVWWEAYVWCSGMRLKEAVR